jgi:hypothetical protein
VLLIDVVITSPNAVKESPAPICKEFTVNDEKKPAFPEIVLVLIFEADRNPVLIANVEIADAVKEPTINEVAYAAPVLILVVDIPPSKLANPPIFKAPPSDSEPTVRDVT